jgi:hypothetical protein
MNYRLKGLLTLALSLPAGIALAPGRGTERTSGRASPPREGHRE